MRRRDDILTHTTRRNEIIACDDRLDIAGLVIGVIGIHYSDGLLLLHVADDRNLIDLVQGHLVEAIRRIRRVQRPVGERIRCRQAVGAIGACQIPVVRVGIRRGVLNVLLNGRGLLFRSR